ncbi:DNA replication/repair protein RecF [Moraxella sp. ZY200743]|uniref:DNA replication/repair protein RecF n=1 Tax=Moraxella sp. ZY200743 TaxID=2911970 RepID=UPI003D7E362C
MIHQLRVHTLRNLHQVSLSLADCNLIIGQNGSGKTSLLEAVFLLSRGKSFRHHEPRRYITHHAKACTIWARIDGDKTIAIQKQLDAASLATTTLKVDHSVVNSQSVLSFLLPTLLIDPAGMAVLEEGSANRRQLLDWLSFHVEPKFYPAWLAYQRLLKQRNTLLKSAYLPINELGAWDRELSSYASVLHKHRRAVFDEWRGFFDAMVGRLLPSYQERIYLAYQAGFDDKLGLFDILQSRSAQDRELGYTRIGAHRADVTILLKQTNEQGEKIREQAVNVLSRGEKKLLITALKLSQLQMICQYLDGIKPVVLIDDIDAELDEQAVDLLLGVLLSLPCQVFITSLQMDIKDKITDKLRHLNRGSGQFKVFHVEQGDVEMG